ncbi:MAG: hypothetical protein AAGA00_13160 [Pseudomonadota bacterium]
MQSILRDDGGVIVLMFNDFVTRHSRIPVQGGRNSIHNRDGGRMIRDWRFTWPEDNQKQAAAAPPKPGRAALLSELGHKKGWSCRNFFATFAVRETQTNAPATRNALGFA